MGQPLVAVSCCSLSSMTLEFGFYNDGIFFIMFLLKLLRLPRLCGTVNWFGDFKLVSLPGGEAFGKLEKHLGSELRTVWLGEERCHNTQSDHPFNIEECKLDRSLHCWQCSYIVQVKQVIADGNIPVAATTNLAIPEYEAEHGAGSSELPGEVFQRRDEKPVGWGLGWFHNCRLDGCRRRAVVHGKTRQPLGIGCRWEWQFLDQLEVPVLCVAQPPLSLLHLLGPVKQIMILVAMLSVVLLGHFFVLFGVLFGTDSFVRMGKNILCMMGFGLVYLIMIVTQTSNASTSPELANNSTYILLTTMVSSILMFAIRVILLDDLADLCGSAALCLISAMASFFLGLVVYRSLSKGTSLRSSSAYRERGLRQQ